MRGSNPDTPCFLAIVMIVLWAWHCPVQGPAFECYATNRTYEHDCKQQHKSIHFTNTLRAKSLFDSIQAHKYRRTNENTQSKPTPIDVYILSSFFSYSTLNKILKTCFINFNGASEKQTINRVIKDSKAKKVESIRVLKVWEKRTSTALNYENQIRKYHQIIAVRLICR